MKKWSRHWKASKQPRKQRKYRYNTPIHVRKKLLSAHLSKELIKKYNRRSVPLREGDEAEIMRGKHKKKRGKVSKLSLRKLRVYIEGISQKRVAGTEIPLGFEPSNLRIVDLNLSDKKRLKTLNKTLKEDEHGKAPKVAVGAKVLESTPKAKTVGSETKTGTSQKI